MTLEEKNNRKMKSLYVQGMSYLLTQPTLTQNINLHSIFKALPTVYQLWILKQHWPYIYFSELGTFFRTPTTSVSPGTRNYNHDIVFLIAILP